MILVLVCFLGFFEVFLFFFWFCWFWGWFFGGEMVVFLGAPGFFKLEGGFLGIHLVVGGSS